MTDERDTPASKPTGKRRTRRRPESTVNRAGLATVVRDRLAELLEREGVTQAEAAHRAHCAPSTLRNMQNGTGKSHYGHNLLRQVARGLGLPEDRLVNAFYPSPPRDPALPSDADVMVQRVMNELEPYLAIIPEMQKQLNGMAEDVAEVSSQLKTLVDINYPPPDK